MRALALKREEKEKRTENLKYVKTDSFCLGFGYCSIKPFKVGSNLMATKKPIRVIKETKEKNFKKKSK